MNTKRWFGEIRVEIRGSRCKQLINMAVSSGVQFWDVQRQDGGLLAWMHPRELSSLRPIVRKTGCRIHILNRRGFIFWWNRAFGRRSMVVGLLACLLLVVLMSSFVWVIEVEGAEEIGPDVILKAAQEEGVEPGVWKYHLNPAEIARGISRRVPRITWAGIELHGVRLSIKIVEKTGHFDVGEGEPAHIVARADGIVEEMYVLKGVPQVAEGESVSQGDILVKGHEGTDGEPSVSARGTVRGLVRYEGRSIIQLEQEVLIPTGSQMVRTYVAIDDTDLPLGWMRDEEEIPFEHYQVQSKKRTWFVGWRHVPFSVEIERLYYKEVTVHERSLTSEQAEHMAYAAAQRQVQGEIPEQATILEAESFVNRQEEEVIVKIQITALQDLGVLRPINIDEDNEHGTENIYGE